MSERIVALVACAVLAGSTVPALAQAGDKAEKFPAPPEGLRQPAATASTAASWRRSSTTRRRSA